MGYPKSGKIEKAGAGWGGRDEESLGKPQGSRALKISSAPTRARRRRVPGPWVGPSWGRGSQRPRPGSPQPRPCPRIGSTWCPAPSGPGAGARSAELGAVGPGPGRARAGAVGPAEAPPGLGLGPGRAGLGMAQPRPLANAGRPRRGSLPAGGGWQVRTRERMAWPKGSAGASGSA